MEESGKVKHLVKKFNKNPSEKINSQYDDDAPTKDTDSFLASKDIKMTKLVTPQGQDEISVTIDIGESDNPDKIPYNITKSIPQSVNGHPHDGGILGLSNQGKIDNQLYSNQINFSLTPVGLLQGSKQNSSPKLSPWLSNKINNNFVEPDTLEDTKPRSIGVDTYELDRIREEEIRMLKEKNNDLDCQIKIKDREIETSKWIDKEMHKRLQTTGDIFFVKSQVKEVQRKLDNQEKLNQDLIADNEKLYEEIRKKDRMILELQSEVDNLDRIMANKKFIHENDENKRILEDINIIRSELIEKERQINENQQKFSNLQRELDKKDLDMHYKNLKFEECIKDRTRYEEEMTILDKRNYKLLESLKAVEKENNIIKRELLRFEDFESKWQEIEDENMYLKQSIQDLEDQYKILEKRQDTSYQVDTLLDELRQALIEKNRSNEERNHLFEQLQIKELIIKDKVTEEKAQLQDINQLKRFIRELEEENALYRKFEKEVGDTEFHLREMERERNALESQLVQLKPKIQKLQVKGLEKDHLITQLVQELKSQIGYLPSDLRKEINKNDIGSLQNQDQGEKDGFNPYLEDDDNNIKVKQNSL